MAQNRAEFSGLLERRAGILQLHEHRSLILATLQHRWAKSLVAQDERAATVAPIGSPTLCRALPACPSWKSGHRSTQPKIPHIVFRVCNLVMHCQARHVINLLQWRCRPEIRPPQAGRTFSRNRRGPERRVGVRRDIKIVLRRIPSHSPCGDSCEESAGECCRQVLCRHSESQRRYTLEITSNLSSSPRNLVSIHHRRRETPRVSPFASATPRLRAVETPLFSWSTTRMRSSFRSRTIFSPPSVDPSSPRSIQYQKTLTQNGLHARRTSCTPLYNGMTTTYRGRAFVINGHDRRQGVWPDIRVAREFLMFPQIHIKTPKVVLPQKIDISAPEYPKCFQLYDEVRRIFSRTDIPSSE